MTASGSGHRELTDSQLDAVLSAVGDELLTHIRATTSPQETLLAIMQGDGNRTHPAQTTFPPPNVLDIPVRPTTELPDLTEPPAELTDINAACPETAPKDLHLPAALHAQLWPLAETPPASDECHPDPDSIALATARRRSGQTECRSHAAGRHRTGARSAPGTPRRKSSRPAAMVMLAATMVLSVLLGSHLANNYAAATGPSATSATSKIRITPRVAPNSQSGTTTIGEPMLAGQPPARITIRPVAEGNSGFVLRGTGWAPGAQTLVTISENGSKSEIWLVVDQKGTFNYTLRRDYELFSDGYVTPGVYQVLVFGAGGQAQTTFRVLPP